MPDVVYTHEYELELGNEFEMSGDCEFNIDGETSFETDEPLPNLTVEQMRRLQAFWVAVRYLAKEFEGLTRVNIEIK